MATFTKKYTKTEPQRRRAADSGKTTVIHKRRKKSTVGQRIKQKMVHQKLLPPTSSCQQVKTATAWVRSQGVKSKLAIFSILMACSSNTFKVSLEEATQRWKQEVSVLGQIDKRARAMSNDLVHQNCFFALHVLFYLQFGRFAWEPNKTFSIEPECPYADDAKNFILTLVKTNRCLCLCYTNYVLAAAEELGYSLVKRCSLPGHVNIAVVFPESQGAVVTDDCQLDLLVPNELDLCFMPKILSYKIYTIIDAGFKDNWYIDIETVEKKFSSLYKMKGMNLVVEKKTDIVCNDRPLPGTEWDTLTAVLAQIAVRRDKQMGRFAFDAKVINAVWGMPVERLKALRRLKLARLEALHKFEEFDFDNVDSEDIVQVRRMLKQLDTHKKHTDRLEARIVKCYEKTFEDIRSFSRRMRPIAYPSSKQLESILNL